MISQLPWQRSVRLGAKCVQVFKCYERRCQGIKLKDAKEKPKHTKKYIKKNSNRYFVETFRNLGT